MPPLTRTGAITTVAIALVFLAVGVAVLAVPARNPLTLGIRLASLWGFLAMAIALLLAPFLADVRRIFGEPFLRVHHVFAGVGLAAITLHPVLVAARSASLAVFLPSLPLLEGYVMNTGRIALPLIYLGVVGSLLRRQVREWRYVHLLLYAALFLGSVHGALISDLFFGNPFLAALYLALGIAVVVVFIAKRIQRRPRPAPRTG